MDRAGQASVTPIARETRLEREQGYTRQLIGKCAKA